VRFRGSHKDLHSLSIVTAVTRCGNGRAAFVGVNKRQVLSLTVIALLTGCAARTVQTRARSIDAAFRLTIPAGSQLIVRAVESIDVTNATEGKVWSAVLARDVLGNTGEVLIAAGSPLTFGVNHDTNGLRLTIHSIMLHGNSYITSTPVDASAEAARRLEPWGASAKVPDSLTTGERIFVPAQALLAVKLGAEMQLR
jgi:hypothetical protein